MASAILIVDDSVVDRCLIGGIIYRNTGHRLDFAGDGAEAMNHITTSRPDLMITDLVMPGMDGLELIRRLRVEHPQIPAILMTAYGNEETAYEALEAGAASYVPKAQQAERLIDTVDRVLRHALADRHRRSAIAKMQTLACSYVLENDPSMVPSIIDQIQETLSSMNLGDPTERIRTCVAVEEAILNAIYHGNLEISEAELAQARHDFQGGSLATVVEARRQSPKLRDRKVFLDVNISFNLAQFVVRDEGGGFHHHHGGHRLRDYFERGLNRGSMLMRSIMDQVDYNVPGNEVTLTKHRSCDPNTGDRVFAADSWSSSGVTAVG